MPPDLKKENVLLKSERRDRRGYVCKLGDFGLSRCGLGGMDVAGADHASCNAQNNRGGCSHSNTTLTPSTQAGCWRSTRHMLTPAGEARAGVMSSRRPQACKNAGMHQFAWSMQLMLLPLHVPRLQLRHCFHCRT